MPELFFADLAMNVTMRNRLTPETYGRLLRWQEFRDWERVNRCEYHRWLPAVVEVAGTRTTGKFSTVSLRIANKETV